MKKKVLNIKQYMDRLKEAQNNCDTESAHAEADCVLCDLLNDLGYTAIVEAYDKVEKWYA